MSQDLAIRNLSDRDVPQLQAILQRAYRNPPFPIGGFWSEEQLQSVLENGQGQALLREPDSGVIQAFVIYQDTGEAWDISVLATDPSAQKQGRMKELLKSVLENKTAGRKVWLEVHEHNLAARNLYEKLGFTAQGRRAKYYRDGSDAILYEFR